MAAEQHSAHLCLAPGDEGRTSGHNQLRSPSLGSCQLPSPGAPPSPCPTGSASSSPQGISLTSPGAVPAPQSHPQGCLPALPQAHPPQHIPYPLRAPSPRISPCCPHREPRTLSPRESPRSPPSPAHRGPPPLPAPLPAQEPASTPGCPLRPISGPRRPPPSRRGRNRTAGSPRWGGSSR